MCIPKLATDSYMGDTAGAVQFCEQMDRLQNSWMDRRTDSYTVLTVLYVLASKYIVAMDNDVSASTCLSTSAHYHLKNNGNNKYCGHCMYYKNPKIKFMIPGSRSKVIVSTT